MSYENIDEAVTNAKDAGAEHAIFLAYDEEKKEMVWGIDGELDIIIAMVRNALFNLIVRFEREVENHKTNPEENLH